MTDDKIEAEAMAAAKAKDESIDVYYITASDDEIFDYEDGDPEEMLYVKRSDHLADKNAALAAKIDEISILSAKLATMREPIWMLREEHDVETADLRARLEAAENRHAEPCRECSAQGMIESVGMEHGSGCTGCCSDCPVPVQVLEPCGACGGYGAIMVPNVPLPETKP